MHMYWTWYFFLNHAVGVIFYILIIKSYFYQNSKTNQFLWIVKLLSMPEKNLQTTNSPLNSNLKRHNEWSLYLNLPFHLANVLLKAAFQQKFLRRDKSRPDFVRFWCSSFGYSMQQLFIIKQTGMQNINHIYLYHFPYISI